MVFLKVANKSLRKILKQIVYSGIYRWFSKNEEDLMSYLKSIDATLWKETKDYVEKLTNICTEELKSRSITIGLPNQGVGGAEWAFLYFLVHFKKNFYSSRNWCGNGLELKSNIGRYGNKRFWSFV